MPKVSLLCPKWAFCAQSEPFVPKVNQNLCPKWASKIWAQSEPKFVPKVSPLPLGDPGRAGASAPEAAKWWTNRRFDPSFAVAETKLFGGDPSHAILSCRLIGPAWGLPCLDQRLTYLFVLFYVRLLWCPIHFGSTTDIWHLYLSFWFSFFCCMSSADNMFSCHITSVRCVWSWSSGCIQF